MARKSVVIDDVMAVVSGNETLRIAVHKDKIILPREISPTGKQRTIKLDVSDEGRDYLVKLATTREKAIERAENAYAKAISSAWADTLDLVEKIEGKDKEEPEDTPEPAEENVAEEHNEEPVVEQYEASPWQPNQGWS